MAQRRLKSSESYCFRSCIGGGGGVLKSDTHSPMGSWLLPTPFQFSTDSRFSMDFLWVFKRFQWFTCFRWISIGFPLDFVINSKGLSSESIKVLKDPHLISNKYAKDYHMISKGFPDDLQWISNGFPNESQWIKMIYKL